jgi:ribosomal protein S18 acetylase RimI-like enzyme
VYEVIDLAVATEYQRQGIGRALVEAAVGEAAARGARRLTLRVLSSNPGARALYESAGFAVEGVLREEFLLEGRYVDDLLMARALTPEA